MGLIEFTANHTDHSNDSGFQFEFHCDHCHNGFMTTFQTNKLSMAGGFLRAAGSLFGGVLGSAASATDHVKDSLRGGARDEAFNKAVQEAKPHFKQCTKCGKWICEAKCWNKKRNLCEACAPDLEEAAASIQARVAVEQLEVKARASDQTEGLDTKQSQSVGECPHCGAKAGGAETVLRTVTNLVCGDAYIIQGQSNAEATGPNNGPSVDPATPISDWIRSYGNSHNGTIGKGWGNAIRTRIWGKPDYGFCQVGAWGMVLAGDLVTKYGIPVCIMNGAVGGTRIDQHQRNEADHKDPATIYGRLLTRIERARLTHGIRGVFWHQGENNQGSSSPTGDYDWKTYQQYFVDLSAARKQDYPNIQHYYVYQIWPNGCNMGGTPAGDMLLEVQRTLPSLFSNMRIMSTLGIVSGSSGRGLAHFDMEGYAQIAKLMSPVVEQDNYGLAVTKAMTAPNLMRAYFTSPARDGIVLEFDQPMAWKDGCRAWIRLDDVPAPIGSGTVSGNAITLKLTSPSEARTVAYLSGRAWDGTAGNLLHGANGIAALAFCAIPLASSAASSTPEIGIMGTGYRILVTKCRFW